jgi:hypothetical protein
MAPASNHNEGSPRLRISGLNHTAFGLAVYASQWRLPATAQDSLPVAGPSSTGRESNPQSSYERFPNLAILSPFPSFVARGSFHRSRWLTKSRASQDDHPLMYISIASRSGLGTSNFGQAGHAARGIVPNGCRTSRRSGQQDAMRNEARAPCSGTARGLCLGRCIARASCENQGRRCPIATGRRGWLRLFSASGPTHDKAYSYCSPCRKRDRSSGPAPMPGRRTEGLVLHAFDHHALGMRPPFARRRVAA